LHSRSHYSIREIIYAFEVIAVVEARGDGRIAATVDDQIALDLSVVDLIFGVNRSDEVIVRSQSIKGRRHRVELHVRSRAHKFVRALFEDDLAAIERNDLHREEARLERRLLNYLFNARLQLGQSCWTGVDVRRCGATRRWLR